MNQCNIACSLGVKYTCETIQKEWDAGYNAKVLTPEAGPYRFSVMYGAFISVTTGW